MTCPITRLPLMWELSRPDAVYDAISAWADLGALPDDAAEQIRSHVASHSEAYQDGDHYRIPNPAILVTGRKA